MPSYFDEGQGAFYRQPTWHLLEKTVYTEWPGSWEELRELADLMWEPELEPVYALTDTLIFGGEYVQVPGYQRVSRSDTGETLSIQSTDYRAITNTDLGNVIESLLGGAWGETRQYEGLFTLFGGKLVICVIRDQQEEYIPGDSSPTRTYTVICSRHDGQGGLKVIRSKIRVVCWNTWSAADHAGVENKTSFVVRHTANWDERVAEVRDQLALAELDDAWYADLMGQMSRKIITRRTTDTFLKRFLPTGDDMGDRQRRNRLEERQKIRELLASPGYDGVQDTVYGLVQAAGEWADHFRAFRTAETYVNRTLLTKEPMKIRAVRLGRQMAKNA